MGTQGINNLVTLIKRLEAVTSRLEDIATTVNYPDLGPALQALKIVPTNLDERHAPLSLQAPDPPIRHLPYQHVPPYIEAFDTSMRTSLHSYIALSHTLGDKISTQADMLQACFTAQRTLLDDAATQAKPTPTDLETLLRPMKDLAAQVVEIAEENRHDQHYEHLSCVANSVEMFVWVVKEMKGWLVVDEAKEAVAFWGNRVIVKHKGKDEKHVEWVRSFYRVLDELSRLIKDEFPSGVVWKAPQRA